MGQRRQPSSVGVSQPQAPPAQWPVQQTTLFNEVGDRISLATVQPAGNDQQEQPECRDADHGRESISQAEGPAEAVDPVWNNTGSAPNWRRQYASATTIDRREAWKI